MTFVSVWEQCLTLIYNCGDRELSDFKEKARHENCWNLLVGIDHIDPNH